MSDDISNVIDMASAKPIAQLAWMARLAKNDSGGNLPTIANALIIFANDPSLQGVLSFNAFTGQHLITRAPPPPEEDAPELPGPYPRAWGPEDVAFMLGYMQRLWSPKFAKATVEDAMVAEASIRRFHPICDWLDGLKWDGKKRLDNWLINAFGCENTAYHKAVGSKFMIAAVRRIRNPGTKFDHMPVLEGKQGIGKSTAIKNLFGEAWFSDSIPQDLTSKDAAMSLLGVWCLEFSEIETLIRAEVETMKAFLSRAVDRYRPPYGKTFVDRPRQGVLIGTTNSDDYLKDTTGNRRIWPVYCNAADAEWVAINRDQLWAEAAYRERAGEAIWLDDAAIRVEASGAQEQRLARDVWYEAIEDWIKGKSEISIPQVLEHGLGFQKDKMTKGHQMRVSDVLKSMGWDRKAVRKGDKTVKVWLPTKSHSGGDVSTDEPWDFEN